MTAARLETALEAWYGRALRLYPEEFRQAYSEPMGQAFRDALKDGSMGRGALLRLVMKDLMISLVKEHFAMVMQTYGRPALVFNALVLAGMATVLALALYAIPQQVLRQGADDPQVEMATNLAARLDLYGVNDGLLQGALMYSGPVVDVAHSLSPFVIVYDDQGRPLGSTAQLDGRTPTPPTGVFDYVRAHGEERVSWQPVLGSSRPVRIAAVVERVSGAQPGFVLAGRSMREVESRIDHVQNLAGLTWLGMMGLIVVGTVVFGWVTRRQVAV